MIDALIYFRTVLVLGVCGTLFLEFWERNGSVPSRGGLFIIQFKGLVKKGCLGALEVCDLSYFLEDLG